MLHIQQVSVGIVQVRFSAENMDTAEDVYAALEEKGEVIHATHNSNRFSSRVQGLDGSQIEDVVRGILGDERQEAPETRLQAQEPCDCGRRVQHNNGGNYHRCCRVNPEGGVTMGSTREPFGGDTKVMCPECGERYYVPRDYHTHPGAAQLEEFVDLLHRGKVPA